MKTVISVPDKVFEEADQLARRLRKSRSQLFSEAIAEYLARHGRYSITNRINTVVDSISPNDDPRVHGTGEKNLVDVEW